MSKVVSLSVAEEVRAHAHARPFSEVAEELQVDVSTGLSSNDASVRLESYGLNQLAEAKRRPALLRFLDQFRDVLILILLGAAVVSFVVSRELKTPLVVLVVVLLNSFIGFIQEQRADASLNALKKMLASNTRVRRDGKTQSVPSGEVVPGDVVLVEAGDRVPADGRIAVAVNLEIDESALTGESQPAAKSNDVVTRAEAALGDRICMAYMNTTVTRGRAELIVTSTGMSTEIGRIAGLLRATEIEQSPLQRQLEGLAHSLAKLSAVIVAAVVAIGLWRGDGISDILNLAVALAVATIPEGLPAVTAVTLAIGVATMAKQNAIVKRLSSVETLGCTSVICSDKTGTLTLNEMTARRLVSAGVELAVSGEGYSPIGEISGERSEAPFALENALIGMALCSDAVVHEVEGEWSLVGDPTEGALVVLAMKGGVDVLGARSSHPRVAEVPFDSSLKFMATFHRLATTSGNEVVRMFVKGAPDVILDRSSTVIGNGGAALAMVDARGDLLAHNDRLAGEGMRVIAIAQRDFPLDAWTEFESSGIPPVDLVGDLVLLSLVGIVDPPRPEAKLAIAEAKQAGIAVKMITGDHASTARAIGKELGLIEGSATAVTGAELDTLSDDELDRRIDEVSVFARVAPEHKIRLVAALQRKSRVVAMTGDGVNDAPALKKSDIGVAMGITGTEVTKEAATMVLTDDNFATIVGAVKRGRAIYDNIVKFVRFQLSTTLGFALLFLAASITGIADGKPFAAIAVLWVNLIMDGPPAMALGLDRPDFGVMQRRPRPMSERILTKSRWVAVSFASVIMAGGTLLVLAFAPGDAAKAGVATVAGTMAFNTFVLFQFFNILNVRNDRLTVFRRETLRNRNLWGALVAVISLQIGVTHWGPMQRLFDTTSISLVQWGVCALVASTVLWLEELRKFVVRTRH
ncbi:MAG: cation-translocating P-type ATPase [Actinomycetota bacterium]